MFLMEVKLDKEKIKREGVYSVEQIEALVEEEIKLDGLFYYSEEDGTRRYGAVQDKDELGRMGAFYIGLRKNKTFFENVEKWNLLRFDEDGNGYYEDIKEQVMKNVKQGRLIL